MRKFILLAILSFVLLAFVKLVLGNPHNNQELVTSFWMKKSFASNKFNLIACGDSRVYRGISKDILDSFEQDLQFLNLGYSSAGLSQDYLEFAVSKLDQNSENKILLIGLSAHSLTKEAKKNEDWKGYMDKGRFDQFRFFYLSNVLKFFSPYKLSNVIKNKKKNYLQDYTNEGWVASNKVRADSNDALKSYRSTFSKYQVEKEDIIELGASIKKLKDSGVEVFIYRMPTTIAMKQFEDNHSGFIESEVKSIAVKNGAHWLSLPKKNFTTYDGSHLTKKSAIELSKELSREIQLSLIK